MKRVKDVQAKYKQIYTLNRNVPVALAPDPSTPLCTSTEGLPLNGLTASANDPLGFNNGGSPPAGTGGGGGGVEGVNGGLLLVVRSLPVFCGVTDGVGSTLGVVLSAAVSAKGVASLVEAEGKAVFWLLIELR